MAGDIWCSNCKRTVGHSEEEGEAAARISRIILPFSPNKRARCIRLAVDVRRRSAHNDSDEEPCHDEKCAYLLELRQDPVRKQHESSQEPSQYHIDDEYHPAQLREARVV